MQIYLERKMQLIIIFFLLTKKCIVDNDNENEQKCILADKTYVETDSSKCNLFIPIDKIKKCNLNNK